MEKHLGSKREGIVKNLPEKKTRRGLSGPREAVWKIGHRALLGDLSNGTTELKRLYRRYLGGIGA